MKENNRCLFHSIRRFVGLAMMAFVLLAPASMKAAADNGNNTADGTVGQVASQQATAIVHPGTDLWRAVRQRDNITEGTTQVRGNEAGSLINPDGETWQNVRMDTLVPYGGLFIAFVLVVTIGLAVFRGKVRIKAGRSGKKLLRFTFRPTGSALGSHHHVFCTRTYRAYSAAWA